MPGWVWAPNNIPPHLVPPGWSLHTAGGRQRAVLWALPFITSPFWQDPCVPWGHAARRVGRTVCWWHSPPCAFPLLPLCPNALSHCGGGCFALSVCTSPPLRALLPALCLRPPLPPSGCVCAFLTDCAIFVCLYLSLTRTTKQWYAHLFFLGSVSSLAPSLPAVEGSCEQLWCCHIHGAGSCPVASLPHG